jgi:hypothetical protein
MHAFVDETRYAETERITLVCDNLNPHRLSSLYEACPSAEAIRITNKLEIVHASRHGSCCTWPSAR